MYEESAAELRALRRKCRELEQTVEILKRAAFIVRDPQPRLICAFITEHAPGFGVAPVCRALTELGVPIARRTYWAHVARAPSKRAAWDISVTEILAGYYERDEHGRRPPECLYGTVKMWAQLQRQGIPAAMKAQRWRGRRGFAIST